ncbi:NAD(P)-binding protein [Bimuria novae-zelandiae CBS 107.79]|uniref:NAD(P)-binding protein n=1 Tax=Bimuria novae-zelandiae CBS 107.79 TaxID=1447943 RepID=A0A6A5VMK2_9PLEO|nr:NAD(P)-binding protein [Bimuria novae-zelandiae CBS 107.79]
MPKTALVTRATGSQGKSVVKHLAKSGWNVHAFVSDSTSERAIALKVFSERVSLYQGSLSDTASIEAAIKGCDAVFLAQMPSWTDDSETREAGILLDTAKAADVTHFAVSTQLGLSHSDVEKIFNHPVLAPAVTGKIAVEKLVRKSGIPWTAIRAGWFNTNVTLPVVDMMYPGLSEGKFVTSYTLDLVIPTVDPDDIGAFTAMIFNNPDKYTGKPVDVVSENLTVAEIVAELERASGKKLDVHYRTPEENEKEANNPFVLGQLVMKNLEGLADMDEMKSHGVPLTSFRQFLEKNKDTVVPK